MVSHAEDARRTPDETESVLIDPLVARKASFSKTSWGGEQTPAASCFSSKVLSRGHRISKLVDTRCERSVLLQGLDQFIGHEGPVRGLLQAGMKGGLSRIETLKTIHPGTSPRPGRTGPLSALPSWPCHRFQGNRSQLGWLGQRCKLNFWDKRSRLSHGLSSALDRPKLGSAAPAATSLYPPNCIK